MTLLYLNALEMGGDCHHVVVSPSTAFWPEWILSVVPLASLE